MPLFSQRKGIRPLAKAIQRESMDDELKNQLWNAISAAVWNQWTDPHAIPGEHERVVKRVWSLYFKHPLDTLPAYDPSYSPSAYKIIREYFFKGKWWETYDLLEFLLKNSPHLWSSNLKDWANGVLETENAAYRIVGDEIVEITDDYEIEAVETALTKGIKHSRTHLSCALELLADRKKPDYRNSIKESISAVESASQVVAGKANATLGDCIKAIQKNGTMHQSFEQALHKLYGYTSDSGGIRHALTDESNNPSYADAKFMLVSCASFVNFLWTKAAESGVTISE